MELGVVLAAVVDCDVGAAGVLAEEGLELGVVLTTADVVLAGDVVAGAVVDSAAVVFAAAAVLDASVAEPVPRRPPSNPPLTELVARRRRKTRDNCVKVFMA